MKNASPPPALPPLQQQQQREVGERWIGRLDLPNKSSYVGQLLQYAPQLVVRDGHGVYRDEVKNKTYEGEFHLDAKQGEGCTTYQNKQHRGTYHKNLRHGPGRFEFFSTHLVYEGEFKYGVFHGTGKLFNVKTRIVEQEGEFRKGLLVAGSRIMPGDGRRYEGRLVDGLESGYGETFFPNGDVYQGYYCMGKMEGRGEYFVSADAAWWRGEFVGNERDCTKPHIYQRGEVTMLCESINSRFARWDGEEEEEADLDCRVQFRLGEFEIGQEELARGTYSTMVARVSAQEFDKGPCLRDGAFAAWHDAQSGNVRFARLGPEGAGPLGRALFTYAAQDSMEARAELYQKEGEVAEVVHL